METIKPIKTNKNSQNICLTLRYPIADSGATLNCLYMNSTSDYDQKIKPIRAQLIDGNKIEAQIQCQMKMDGLPDNAKKAYKFKNMQEHLVSSPVLCDNGCEVTFTKNNAQV